jgi:cbb3-type cytochrome oxidase maturation protein
MMEGMFFLIPITLAMGLAGLAAFVWSLRAKQYEDPEGAAHRILMDDGDYPLP